MRKIRLKQVRTPSSNVQYVILAQFILLSPIYQTEKCLAAELSDLKQFSISRSENKLPFPSKKKPFLTEMVELSHTTRGYQNLYTLTRPSSHLVTAILAVQSNGRPVLNPRHLHFNYGVIPELAELDVATAQQLWGGADKTEDHKNIQLRTYKFISASNNGTIDVSKSFEIDIVFKEGVFSKYKVTGYKTNAFWYFADYEQVVNEDWQQEAANPKNLELINHIEKGRKSKHRSFNKDVTEWLISRNEDGVPIYEKVFAFDVGFENDLLSKYRIRSSGINSEWYTSNYEPLSPAQAVETFKPEMIKIWETYQEETYDRKGFESIGIKFFPDDIQNPADQFKWLLRQQLVTDQTTDLFSKKNSSSSSEKNVESDLTETNDSKIQIKKRFAITSKLFLVKKAMALRDAFQQYELALNTDPENLEQTELARKKLIILFGNNTHTILQNYEQRRRK